MIINSIQINKNVISFRENKNDLEPNIITKDLPIKDEVQHSKQTGWGEQLTFNPSTD